MDQYTHQFVAAGSHTEPWNIAGYVFVAAGTVLLVSVGCSHLASRYRTWRENQPARVLTSAEFAAALAEPDGARLLRVAAPLEPYAVGLGAEDVVIRLAGIDAPATTAPWTAEEDNDRVRTAVRTRLAEAAEAADHPFIAVGTAGSAVVFIDPAQCPGAISIDGDQEAAKALAELLERHSAAAGHDVRFVFGPAEGAQWRWTLAADGELDTGVLGVKVQTMHLATALKAEEARNAAAAATAGQEAAAVDEPDAPDAPDAPAATPAALLNRLGTQPHRGTIPDQNQTTSQKALLVAHAEADDDIDAVSAADPVRAHSADLE